MNKNLVVQPLNIWGFHNFLRHDAQNVQLFSP